MSLINEALRKARQAAAEHDDQRNAGRAPQAYPSRGPRRGAGPAVVALVAILAGLIGAAGVWWIVGTASTEPESADAAIVQVKESGDVQPQTPQPAGNSESAPIDLPGDSEPETPPKIGQTPPTEAPPPAPQSTASPESAPSATAEGSSEDLPDRPTSMVTTSGERVFIIDAELGYASLSLGYIVFRPVRPFAEINGNDVYEGSEVAGFTVDKIEVDRVILSDSRGTLELRVP